MTTWLKCVLRRVLRSSGTGVTARAPGRRTIVWRMEEPSPADQPAHDTDESFAATFPMSAEVSGWMMSSMDLMAGVEVLENDKPRTDPRAHDAEPVRPRQDLP